MNIYRKSVVISFLMVLFFGTQLFCQKGGTNIDVDSLFNEYLQLKGVIPALAPESMTGKQTYDNHGTKCGFGTSVLMHQLYENLSEEKRTLYRKLNSRPVLPYSVLTPSGKFRIHYNNTGSGKPAYIANVSVDENISRVAAVLDSVYNFEVGFLGFLPVPDDGSLGGDGACDIYIQSLGGGNYGATTIDNDGNSIYIEVDNDFMDDQISRGISGLEVALAHEYHHAIQITNYNSNSLSDELYMYESTSVAMEEFVFDDVNDYYNYLPEYFSLPQKPFMLYGSYDMYSLGIWQIYLKERFGYSIIKREWELFANNHSLDAMNQSIIQYGSSFKSELNTFGLWSCYTGYRKAYDTENKYFEEGANYPVITLPYTYKFEGSDKSYTLTTKPMANNFLRFSSFNGTYNDSIIAVVTNADLNSGISGSNNDYKYIFKISSTPMEGCDLIANNYYAGAFADNQDYYRTAFIFNGKTNPGTYYIKETDDPYPVPFSYNKNANLRLPVSYNSRETADIYVYTTSMELVYKGTSSVKSPDDKFVAEWNGRNSEGGKLASGVYIYVTDSNGGIKKGKVVIINE